MTTHNAADLKRLLVRWPYQANVMKTFEIVRSKMVRTAGRCSGTTRGVRARHAARRSGGRCAVACAAGAFSDIFATRLARLATAEAAFSGYFSASRDRWPRSDSINSMRLMRLSRLGTAVPLPSIGTPAGESVKQIAVGAHRGAKRAQWMEARRPTMGSRRSDAWRRRE